MLWQSVKKMKGLYLSNKKVLEDSKIQHIRLIMCNNSRDRSAELILMNGYAGSLEKAYEIVDKENGK